MSTFFQYINPSELVNDIQNGRKVFFDKGLVSNIAVNSKETSKDGFVMIFAYNYNSVYQNLNRYSYSLTQFRLLTFSLESAGLYYYSTIDPINNITTNWTNNILTAGEKSEYISAANNMLKNNLVVKWKLEWNLQTIPAPIIEITNSMDVVIPNNSEYTTADIIINTQNTISFKIKNKGTSRLEITDLQFFAILGIGDTISDVVPIDEALKLDVGEVANYTLNFNFANPSVFLVPNEITIMISSNDPFVSDYTFTLKTLVNATPAPIASYELISDTNVFIFDIANPSISSLSRDFKIKLNNTGNADLNISTIDFTTEVIDTITDIPNTIIIQPPVLSPIILPAIVLADTSVEIDFNVDLSGAYQTFLDQSIANNRLLLGDRFVNASFMVTITTDDINNLALIFFVEIIYLNSNAI